METHVVKASDEDCLHTAVEIIMNGGVVALPTDTVYGIGSSAFDNDAVLKLYKVKERKPELAVPILIFDLDQVSDVAKEFPSSAIRLAEAFWPGPLTLVVTKSDSLAYAVSASGTVGIRMPNHDFARSLLKLAGPMAVTSANLSGRPSLSSASDVFDEMDGRIELVIDGGRTPGGIPSTVVDCSQGMPVKILRKGPVSQEQIEQIFEA